MSVVCLLFRLVHTVYFQLFLYFFQAGSLGTFRYFSCIQIVNPFFQRCFRHLVEVVHLQDVIFRIKLAHLVHLESLSLEWTKF